MDVIAVRDAIHVYPTAEVGVAALRGLDLSIRPGELAAIVGPSGSGKSTLLRLLGGVERPTAGSVQVDGLALERATPAALSTFRRTTVSVVEQHYWRAVSPFLPVRDAVAQPLALRGVDRSSRRARAGELLERVGLGDHADALPTSLSGGEQQRVAVAMALAPHPTVLLADEPTGELDARTAGELMRLLRDVIREAGTTCVVVTHDEQVEAVADRIVFLQDGRAVAERTGGGATGPRSVGRPTARRPISPRPPQPPNLSSSVEPAARLDRVSRTYRTGGRARPALAEVSAAFGSGGVHAVTGPSGSGKSTLLRLLAGIDRPDSGRVETLGLDLGALDRSALAELRARRLGFVPQSSRLVPFLTAAENVALGLSVRGVASDEAAARAVVALERVGLGGLADRRPEALSGGERARVAVAGALAAEPELLLLDEPTSALDRAGAARLMTMLEALDGTAVTVIVATHDPQLTAAASDRVDIRDLGAATLGGGHGLA